jgi:DNA-binding phage protein
MSSDTGYEDDYDSDYAYTNSRMFEDLLTEDEMQEIADSLPDSMDIEELMDSINSEANDKLLDRTMADVQREKNRVLQSIGLSREELKTMHRKLREYMYIDELRDLTYGAYLRWMPLDPDADPYLRRGGFLVDIDFGDRGLVIRILTLARTHVNIYFDSNIIFQKLTESNLLLLELVNHIRKT